MTQEKRTYMTQERTYMTQEKNTKITGKGHTFYLGKHTYMTQESIYT
jgi:ribosomal protein L31